MSRTPYFYIEKYNTEHNIWEKQTLYYCETKTQDIKEVDVWPWNGTHDVFNIINHTDDIFPHFTGVRHIFPNNASPEVCDEYEKNWFRWGENKENISKPNAFYFTLADLLLYIKEYPIVKDYDAMEEYWTENEDTPWNEVPERTMPNPMSDVATRVMNYMDFVEDWWSEFSLKSEIRIVGWIL